MNKKYKVPEPRFDFGKNWKRFLSVLDDENIKVDENIQKLIKERNKARLEKNWEKADQMRKQLDEMGIILDDTSEGTVWKKK